MLVAKLRQFRDEFMRAASRAQPRGGRRYVRRAEWLEEAAQRIEQLTFLETAMRNADETIRALINDDKANRQKVADLTAAGDADRQKVAQLTLQLDAAQRDLAAAQANSLTPETLAAAVELVPEAPPTEG